MRIAGLVCLLVVTASADDRADLLRDGDWEQRQLLLDELTELPAEVAVPILVEALQLDDTYTAGRAAQMLRIYGDDAKPAVPALIQTLYHESPTVQKYAYETLHWLGRAARGAEQFVREIRVTGVTHLPPDRHIPRTPEPDLSGRRALDALIATLQDPDPSMRTAAARALGFRRSWSDEQLATIETGLRRALADKAWAVRGRAAESLGKLAVWSPETLDALAVLLSDSSMFVRAKATQALVWKGERASAHLEAALEGGDLRVQRRVAAALDGRRCPSALGTALAALAEGRDRPARLAAIRALAKAGEAKLVVMPRIVKLLETEDWEQRQAVYGFLRQMGTAGAPAIPALLRAVPRGEYDAQYVVGVLATFGKSAHPALIGMYDDVGPSLRPQILFALSSAREPTPELLALLERGQADPDARVRQAASAALKRLPEPDPTTAAEMLDILTRTTNFGEVGRLCHRLLSRSDLEADPVALLEDEHWQLRYFALQAISRHDRRGPELIEIVTTRTEDENPHVKAMAAVTLRQLSRPRPADVEALSRQLESEDPEEALQAIRTFLLVPELAAPALPRLATLARTGDKKVREAALGLMRHLGDPAVEAAIELLTDSDERLRRDVRDMLGRMRRDQAVSGFLKLRTHESEQLRVEAVYVLRRQGQVESLVDWLDDPSPAVRKAVVEALAGNRSKRSLPGLLRVLEGDDAALHLSALIALGRYRDEATTIVPAVAPFLFDDDPKTREFAAATLGRMGRAADATLDRALVSKEPLIRATALSGIRGRPDGLELLQDAYRDDALPVRLAACRICRTWKEAAPLLFEAAGSADPKVRREALGVVAQLNPLPKTIIPIALEALEVSETRHEARRLLGRLFPESIDALLEKAEALRRDSIRDAFRGFGSRAVPGLLEHLADERVARRRVAIWALGALGKDGKDAVPHLKELAKREPALAGEIDVALKEIRR